MVMCNFDVAENKSDTAIIESRRADDGSRVFPNHPEMVFSWETTLFSDSRRSTDEMNMQRWTAVKSQFADHDKTQRLGGGKKKVEAWKWK